MSDDQRKLHEQQFPKEELSADEFERLQKRRAAQVEFDRKRHKMIDLNTGEPLGRLERSDRAAPQGGSER